VTRTELTARIKADERFTIQTTGDVSVVLYDAWSGSGGALRVAIDWTRVPDDLRWDELEPVLLGRRLPQPLHFMARIVGYYSRVDQWNRSKLAELADRHKGNYGVPKGGSS